MRALVDTSVWSLALRRRAKDLNAREKTLVRELSELIKEGRAAIIGAVRQEVLSGIRDEMLFERLRQHLRFFPDDPTVVEDYEQAARFSNHCRAAGIAGTPVDFVICSVATRLNLAIFTTDPDFRHYAKCVPIHLHVVQPD